MGGLARRATLIQQTRDTVAGAVLVVDSGDSMLGNPLSLRSDGRVMIEAMNLMGYDALGVGTGELMKGPEVLRARIKEADFPVISANLVDTASGEPVFEPFAIIEKAGLRFGVIGITDTGALQGLESSWPGVSILDAPEILAGRVAELEPQVDLIVVLARLGAADAAALARKVPGIDVIVGGAERYVMTEAQTAGDTIIVHAGYDGEWLSRLDLSSRDGGFAMAGYQVLYMRPEVAYEPVVKALVERYYGEFPE